MTTTDDLQAMADIGAPHVAAVLAGALATTLGWADENLPVAERSLRQAKLNGVRQSLGAEDFDTVAGLVMKNLGRLPRRGEAVTFEDLELRVVRVDRRRIDMLRVTCNRDLPTPPVSAAD